MILNAINHQGDQLWTWPWKSFFLLQFLVPIITYAMYVTFTWLQTYLRKTKSGVNDWFDLVGFNNSKRRSLVRTVLWAACFFHHHYFGYLCHHCFDHLHHCQKEMIIATTGIENRWLGGFLIELGLILLHWLHIHLLLPPPYSYSISSCIKSFFYTQPLFSGVVYFVLLKLLEYLINVQS